MPYPMRPAIPLGTGPGQAHRMPPASIMGTRREVEFIDDIQTPEDIEIWEEAILAMTDEEYEHYFYEKRRQICGKG